MPRLASRPPTAPLLVAMALVSLIPCWMAVRALEKSTLALWIVSRAGNEAIFDDALGRHARNAFRDSAIMAVVVSLVAFWQSGQRSAQTGPSETESGAAAVREWSPGRRWRWTMAMTLFFLWVLPVWACLERFRRGASGLWMTHRQFSSTNVEIMLNGLRNEALCWSGGAALAIALAACAIIRSRDSAQPIAPTAVPQ